MKILTSQKLKPKYHNVLCQSTMSCDLFLQTKTNFVAEGHF